MGDQYISIADCGVRDICFQWVNLYLLVTQIVELLPRSLIYVFLCFARLPGYSAMRKFGKKKQAILNGCLSHLSQIKEEVHLHFAHYKCMHGS